MYHRSFFGRFATGTARAMGHPLAFLLAVLIIVGWAVTGPLFGFSDTWQLVINTSTTIVTFLMVFLIQHSQNRDSTAVQLKLDELIRAMLGAHNSLMDLEELEAEDLERIRASYEELARRAREQGVPDLVNLQTPEAPNTEGPAIHSRLVLLDHTGQVIWSAPFGPPREGTA